MALSTYAELQTSLSAWLDGSAFSGREADFITLAEDEINARLAAGVNEGRGIRPMQARADVTIDAEYVTPADFDMIDVILPISFEVSGLDSPWRIKYMGQENLVGRKFDEVCERDQVSGMVGSTPPRYYTMIGDEFRFFASPESGDSFTAEFTYYAKIPALSDSNTSNWVLANHRNAYLYGALAQAEMFGWADNRMANLATMFANACEGILVRYPVPVDHTPLTSELNGFSSGGMTINSFMRGY